MPAVSNKVATQQFAYPIQILSYEEIIDYRPRSSRPFIRM